MGIPTKPKNQAKIPTIKGRPLERDPGRPYMVRTFEGETCDHTCLSSPRVKSSNISDRQFTRLIKDLTNKEFREWMGSENNHLTQN